jgi:hypothetical protein
MRDLFTEYLPFSSRVFARRGLHTIDNANDAWQIEVVDRPSESLRAHEECSKGCIYWVKRAGVLNLGNYYFPHSFGPLRVSYISSGITMIPI